VKAVAIKRVVVLSDGMPTTESDAIAPLADDARCRGITIDCVALGDTGYSNEALLADVARRSAGKMLTVRSLAQLSAALQQVPGGGLMRKRRHTMTIEIICVDVSPSMLEAKMEGQRKIDVAVAAIMTLLRWRQHQNFTR
jgi:Mg-chelatase subunit ChlD